MFRASASTASFRCSAPVAPQALVATVSVLHGLEPAGARLRAAMGAEASDEPEDAAALALDRRLLGKGRVAVCQGSLFEAHALERSLRASGLITSLNLLSGSEGDGPALALGVSG